MSLSLTVLVLALGAAGDGGATPRAARLVDGDLRLAQTPPPLVDAPPEEPGPSPTPAPEAGGRTLPVDRYANTVNPFEVAAVAGSLLLLDLTSVVAGYIFVILALSLSNGAGLAVGIVGVGAVILGNLVATPLLASMVAGMVAPAGYRAGGTTKSTLYAAGVHGGLIAAWVILSVIAQAAGNSESASALVGLGALALLAGRYVGIGLAASWGLHSGPETPPPPKTRTPATRRAPPTSPTELALAERRFGAVPLLALSF